MKTKKSEFAERFTVSVNTKVVKAIQTSGQSAPDWLRQAAQRRLNDEQPAETPISRLEKEIAGLKQNGAEIRQELLKFQQSDAITQATLAEVQKGLGVLEKNQHVLHQFLKNLDQNISLQFQALGTSLLTDLREQLPDMVKTQEEPSRFKNIPVPPRTRL